ncbi:MAG: aminotransferase class I/II-fold pyridoxal phosphate-dependent enzyme [Spirochaetaceae bacterium]|jgi:histidinol-phosphate aminotransferase|nr:aminotransferase class I/II-fold pyridoxal phosphate-dependent enzyme [Spirochaetaceae bacterium]
MSKYWNERVKGLSPYVPGEYPRDRRIIKLNTNENPYPPSPRVIEAIRNAAGEDLRFYPDPTCGELREVIAEKYGVSKVQVFVGNGSDEVLAFAFGAFFESAAPSSPAVSPAKAPPRPVLFPDISYSFYPVYARLWGVPFRTIPLDEDFALRAEDYQALSGGVILPNPNAPTGRALSLDGVRSIAAGQLREGGGVVIVDEAYRAFGLAQAGESALSLIDEYPNLLTVYTLSKAASLAGLRVGFAIGGEDLIEGLCRIRDSFNSYTLDRLALAGAAAAVADSAYYEAINRRVMATRDRVSAALIAMGLEVIPSSTNFLFIRFPGKSGARVFATLRERGILARHFDRDRIRDFLRVSIGTDGEMDVFLEECRTIAGG